MNRHGSQRKVRFLPGTSNCRPQPTWETSLRGRPIAAAIPPAGEVPKMYLSENPPLAAGVPNDPRKFLQLLPQTKKEAPPEKPLLLLLSILPPDACRCRSFR